MAKKLTFQLNAVVTGGPALSEKIVKTVEAYDKISVNIPGATPDPVTAMIELQPAQDLSRVLFLALLSSHYHADVTYTVNEYSYEKKLEDPLFLVGPVAVDLLIPPNEAPPEGTYPLQYIYVTNRLQEAITITALVGRDATP